MKLETSPNKFPTPLAGGSTPSVVKSRRQMPVPEHQWRDLKSREIACRHVASGTGSCVATSTSSPKGRAPAHPPAKARQALAYRSALALFAWSVALLISDQAHAAGVCIVCPPGHTCPAGGAPIITGSPGQILIRTESGTEWTDMVDFMGVANTALCNQARVNSPATESVCSASPHSAGVGTGRYCLCRMGPGFFMNRPSFPDCSYDPFVFVHEFAEHTGPNGCTGTGDGFNCVQLCYNRTDWRIQS